jgi:hypothetical protein
VFWLGGQGMTDILIQSGNTETADVVGLGWQYGLDAELDIAAELDLEDDLIPIARWYISVEAYGLNGQFAGNNSQLDIVALKPILRFDSENHIFYEASIGIAHFSDKQFEEITTGSHTQFALHFAVGYYLNDKRSWHSSIRYNHYSNGYLSQPNPGIDFLSLQISYDFN